VADTEQLGEGKRNQICEAFSTLEKQRYNNAGEGVTPQTIVCAMREWLFAPDVPSDKLEWSMPPEWESGSEPHFALPKQQEISG
jgi:hypothetical protein